MASKIPRPARLLNLGLLLLAAATPKLLAQPAPDPTSLTGGLAVISQPRYPGSGQFRTRVLPMLSWESGRYYLGGGSGAPPGAGVFLFRTPAWTVGLGLGADFDKPRRESDSPRLRGLGSIAGTARGTLFVNGTGRHFALRAQAVTDVAGKGQGTQVSVDLDGRLRLAGRLILTAGPGATWADRSYRQTFFGIDAAQSAASGQTPYQLGSGLQMLRVNAGALVLLGPKWAVGGRATLGRLQGDAAASPITEKKAQTTFAVFGSCRF